MRIIAILLIVLTLSVSCIPAYAVGSLLSAIPDDYYIHFFAGAAIEGLLQKHDVTPAESFYITLGLAIAKEVVDSAIFGGQAELAEAAVTVLGAGVMYFF